jgi:serine/threonine protein kinase
MTTGSSPPPRLQGFDFESPLGSGGFADVFLYRQALLNRMVAVKVMRRSVSDPEAERAFVAEAKLMASVSAHPYIVTVFDADVADDGRPYIVMEYYSRPNFAQKMKPTGLPVAECLRVGVQLASAVETAHRAGILHRDIKPANVLSSEYDRPGLTDFGISGTRADGSVGASLGFSTAYAPPEVLLDQSPGDERSDVYALAACLYAFLTGRSPFERLDGDNSRAAMTKRILAEQPPPTAKPGVPPRLDQLLALTLAKDPSARPASAAAFARLLQSVQQELRLEPTPLELREDARPVAPDRSDHTDEDGTRLGRIRVIDPESPSVPVADRSVERSRPAADGPLIQGVPERSSTVGNTTSLPTRPPTPRQTSVDDGRTVIRQRAADAPAPAPGTEETEQEQRRTPWTAAIVGLVVVVILGATAAFTLRGGSSDAAAPTVLPFETGGGGLILVSTPDPPSQVEVKVSGTVATVSWSPPAGVEVDYFIVTRDARSDREEQLEASASPLRIEGIERGVQICVEVVSVAAGRFSEASPTVCSEGA